MFRECLNEAFGACKIAGYEYETADALETMDPTAYRCGFSEWLDSKIGDDLWEHPEGGYCDEDPAIEAEDEAFENGRRGIGPDAIISDEDPS